ncbi:MAG TPA: acetate--CoA ligase [Fibrobacteria bacterium]|nr:acetate--CoA ligase [Fibrobacteria bacterium]
MSGNIESVLNETRKFVPPEAFRRKAAIASWAQYEAMYQESIQEPETFWGKVAEDLHWFKKWSRVRNWDNPPFAKWFEGGRTNLSYNCLDRHLDGPRKNKVALLWEGEPLGERKALTYLELHRQVCKFANVLKSRGIRSGDTVALYLPMVPELAIAMLACARIGAVHSIIFGGFSAPALVDRINDAECKAVVTADGGYRRGSVLRLKDTVDEALKSCPTVKTSVVVRRAGVSVDMVEGRDYWWSDLMYHAKAHCPAEELDSEHPLYILYTSGSTGKPKGIQHTTGGYMVGAYLTSKYIFDIKEEDTYWCTADIGWVTGHSYVVYGPLANGATTLMYEGAPNFPDFDRFWRIVERHKVNIFYTAPTAIRSFMKWGEEHPRKYDLSSLRLLGSVGEPINPEAWMWYHENIGGGKCPIVDTWWQTETGAIMISPLPGVTPTKPGSATFPFFGVEPAIVNDKGEELGKGQGGLLVMKQPWPSMLRTLYKADDRYQEVYWSRFRKQGWYLAGDGAVRDEDGYIWILGRIDDVLNVSGHRLSTMEVESALVAHDAVVEAAVVGFKHEVKGEGVAAFVILAKGAEKGERTSKALQSHVRTMIGALAAPDQIHFTEALPKTRSGKIMRRLLRDVANGVETKSDMSTLDDLSVLAKLRQDEE